MTHAQCTCIKYPVVHVTFCQTLSSVDYGNTNYYYYDNPVCTYVKSVRIFKMLKLDLVLW